jgi:transposase
LLAVAYFLIDRGYADWFREGLRGQGIEPCIPFVSSRKVQLPHDTNPYKRRHKIENMVSRWKDWRPIAARYNRYTHTSSSSFSLTYFICFCSRFYFFPVKFLMAN